jgi:hypothetical protein
MICPLAGTFYYTRSESAVRFEVRLLGPSADPANLQSSCPLAEGACICQQIVKFMLFSKPKCSINLISG